MLDQPNSHPTFVRPPGQLFLRIGIFDHTSNKTGTLEIPLTAPKK
jgi:hypothetical protein